MFWKNIDREGSKKKDEKREEEETTKCTRYIIFIKKQTHFILYTFTLLNF